MERNANVIRQLTKVPYSHLVLEEGRECMICLATFQKNEEVMQLKCHKYHVFHAECLT